jgi:hypothetical protein
MAARGFDMAERNYGWNRHGALIAATVLDPDSTAAVASVASVASDQNIAGRVGGP